MDWFLRRDNVVEGPLADEEVRRRLREGSIDGKTPLSPNRIDFRPLKDWSELSSEGSLVARDFLRVETASPRVSSDGFSKDGRTAIVGTEAPYLAEVAPTRGGKGTALMGTPAVEGAEPKDETWPGAAQSDPDQSAALSPPRAESAPEPRSFFESIPVEPPSPREETPRAEGPENAEAFRSPVRQAPFPDAVLPRHRPPPRVALPPLSPTKDALAWLPLTLAAGVTLVLIWAGLALTDRLLNGPVTSGISRYLPAGASAYVEVPSIRRWGHGVSGLDFFDSDSLDLRTWLQSLEDPSQGKLELNDPLHRVVSFALARIGQESLFAVEYDDDPSVDALIASRDELSDTEWGPRYRKTPTTTCLWIREERVELCGTGDSLDAATGVLAGRAPSAEDDPYLKAAKKRSWSSYLPFVTQPGLYAVATPRLLAASPFLKDLSQATVRAGIDDLGYFETLDLVWPAGKAPSSSGDAPLTFWKTLPEGTVFYVNYRARPPRTPEELRAHLAGLTAAAPEAPSPERILEQIRGQLGFDPSALFEGLGDEGLLALSADPKTAWQPKAGPSLTGAVWLVQSIEDPGKVRRTVTSLVERFSEERAGLSWQNDDNLVADGPEGMRVHLRFEQGRLRIGMGQRAEIERVLSGGHSLREDEAHEAAVSELDQERHVMAWLDWGRVLRAPELLDAAKVPPPVRQTLITEGPDRPVGAWGVRRFETGDLRVRSRNFPTGLLLLAVSAAGEVSALSQSFGVDTASSGAGLSPAASSPTEPKEPEWIEPGPDGSFRLPSP